MVERSRKELTGLRDSEPRRVLDAMAEFVVARAM
jgi:hypothetical protein